MKRTKAEVLANIKRMGNVGCRKNFSLFNKVQANLQREMGVNKTKGGINRLYVPASLPLKELLIIENIYSIALDVVEG